MKGITGAAWVSCAALAAAAIALSQEASTPQGGAPPAGDQGSAAGPVRLVRVSYAQGDVSWRPDDASAWSPATTNLPIQQGAEVWVKGGARAELQFDDGSDLRLGDGAVVTLQSLYSDSQGEFTEVKLNSGSSELHLKDKYSIYQVDAPFESVKVAGPAKFRVDVGTSDEVQVITGSATVSNEAGDTTLRSGDFVAMNGPGDPVRVQTLPPADGLDRFSADRDAAFAKGTEHLPPNIGLVAGDLDNYGAWHNDPTDGWVWAPRERPDWRPYSDGQWVANASFGWTWDGYEPWGWAPYHYGTWGHYRFGWGWCPGPYNQYWSPAVVDFSLYNGEYCWTPLCPGEVAYPAVFGCGFGLGDWWLNFSIGGCGVYEPGFGGFCRPIAFGRGDWDRGRWGHEGFGDRGGFGGNGFGRGGFGGNGGQFGAGGRHGFVPRNAAFGATTVGQNGFGQRGGFRNVNRNSTHMFSRGQSVTSGSRAFSGPVGARMGSTSMTPTHTLGSTQRPGALDRSLYRAPVSSSVARTSQPFGRMSNSGRALGSSGRSGSLGGQPRTPGLGSSRSSGMSAVERAWQSIGYRGSGNSGRSGFGLSSGSRGSGAGGSGYGSRSNSSSGTSSYGQRSTTGMSAVQRARQSLGYSGAGYSGRSGAGSSGSSSRGNAFGGSASPRNFGGTSYTGARSGRAPQGATGYSQRSSMNSGAADRARRSLGSSGSGSSSTRGAGSVGNGGSSPRTFGGSSYTGARSGRAPQGATGYSPRSSISSSTADRARRSLGSSGSGSSSTRGAGSYGSGGYRSSGASTGGSSGYGGYRGSSQSSVGRGYSGGSSGGSRGYSGSSSGGSRGYSGGNSGGSRGYSGGNSGGSRGYSSGSSGGSRGNSGGSSRGNSGGGSRGSSGGGSRGGGGGDKRGR